MALAVFHHKGECFPAQLDWVPMSSVGKSAFPFFGPLYELSGFGDPASLNSRQLKATSQAPTSIRSTRFINPPSRSDASGMNGVSTQDKSHEDPSGGTSLE
jgi:hypothetical protein